MPVRNHNRTTTQTQLPSHSELACYTVLTLLHYRNIHLLYIHQSLMMRLLFFALLLSGPIYGQTPSDSARVLELPPVYIPRQRTAADTAEALHLMFRNRRTVGGILVALGVITAVTTPITYASLASPSTSTYGNLPQAMDGTKLGFIIASPIIALSLFQLSGSSKEKENQTVYNYTYSHILPKKIARKLRPELFLPRNFPHH